MRIYTREHPPAHVHVVFSGCNVRVSIFSHGVEFNSISKGRPNTQDIRPALEAVAANLEACLAKWKEIHGNT